MYKTFFAQHADDAAVVKVTLECLIFVVDVSSLVTNAPAYFSNVFLYEQGIFLGMRLQVPLETLGDMGSYLRSGGKNAFDGGGGAQPMLTAQLLRPAGTGAHLSTSGLEFDEKILRFGPDCALRMAASLDFPREYPPPQPEDGPVRLNIKKLGVKKCFRWYKQH